MTDGYRRERRIAIAAAVGTAFALTGFRAATIAKKGERR
jgi:hypothetical protein